MTDNLQGRLGGEAQIKSCYNMYYFLFKRHTND